MDKKSKLTQHDLDAFHEAVKDTTPLSQQKKRTLSRPARPAPSVRIPAKENINIIPPDESAHLPIVDGVTNITYHRPGIPNKTLRKMRKGQYTIEAKLDLHGMTIEVAHQAVCEFISNAIADGIRMVLIIHGKGQQGKKPILKNKLNHWLRNTNLVLAFCSANTFHGSRGALYVLLKQQEENPG